VVFFYGGSWQSGQRQDYRFVAAALASHGVIAIVPDYRKSPRYPFPAFMQDAAAAVAWSKANAVRYGGDPARIFVMGHSAGGQIAALLATDARYLQAVGMQPHDLAGVIGLAGPYDFLPITDPTIKTVFGPEKDWPLSQPVNFVDGDEPPFLLMHGASDTKVWPMNSEHLAAKLRAQHEAVTLEIVPDTGHIGLINGFASPRFSPVLDDSLRWIDATVRSDH
jgi:acetyl esterase/lipase